VPPGRSAGAHPCRHGTEAATSPTVKPAVTVLAVDDQPIFLRAAHQLIADTPGFEQVGEATSGPEALEMAAALHPDLVLLDVRMPGMDGIETARRMVALDARAVVVLVSLEETPELPASMATVGAAVHLRKQDLSTRALQEIWTTHGG
jgi:two-component system, NarL family, invasion response regulator UvrY